MFFKNLMDFNLGYTTPRIGAESFAFIRNNFPDIESYEQTPEDMQKFFNAIYEVYPGEIESLFMISRDPAIRERMHVEIAKLFHVLFRWARFNMPVFDLTEDLTADLTMTDVSDMACSAIKFPFPTFCIQIPRGFWRIEGSPVESIWVHRFVGHTKQPGGGGWRAEDIQSLGDAWELTSTTSFRRLGPKREMLYINIIAANRVSVYDNTPYGSGNYCLPGEDVDGTIGDWIAEKKEATHFMTGEMRDADFGLQKSVKRLIVNLMLYSAERDFGAPIKPRRRYTKRAKQTAMVMDPEIWVLGTRVKARPQVIDAAKQAGGESLARWRLKKRIVVKGHWRRQPIGKRGLGLWKPIWIKPYPKGEGPRYTHIYEGDDPGQGQHISKKKKRGKKRRRRRNPVPTYDQNIELLEQEADEAAETAEAYYAQGHDDYGDYFADQSDALFDKLEQLTGEVYE